MVLGTTEKKEHEGPLSEKEVMSMAIYPMAIPLLLNPVGIVTLTVFSCPISVIEHVSFVEQVPQEYANTAEGRSVI
jgi:small neutral amino acid transporter SnatA (MarC family)